VEDCGFLWTTGNVGSVVRGAWCVKRGASGEGTFLARTGNFSTGTTNFFTGTANLFRENYQLSVESWEHSGWGCWKGGKRQWVARHNGPRGRRPQERTGSGHLVIGQRNNAALCRSFARWPDGSVTRSKGLLVTGANPPRASPGITCGPVGDIQSQARYVMVLRVLAAQTWRSRTDFLAMQDL